MKMNEWSEKCGAKFIRSADITSHVLTFIFYILTLKLSWQSEDNKIKRRKKNCLCFILDGKWACREKERDGIYK